MKPKSWKKLSNDLKELRTAKDILFNLSLDESLDEDMFRVMCNLSIIEACLISEIEKARRKINSGETQ